MEALGVDFKLLVAQAVNFLVVFVVLKKFLYKPILKYLDDRKKRIRESLENTQKIEERLEKIEKEQAEILNRARYQGQKEKEEIKKRAEQEKEAIIKKARETAQKELEKGLALLKEEESASLAKVKSAVSDTLLKQVETRLVKNLQEPKAQRQLIRKILAGQ